MTLRRTAPLFKRRNRAQPFVFTINTANTSSGSTANNQFRLPLVSSGNYNFIVNWGDSTSDTITVWNGATSTHTYPSTGIYTVTIEGTCERWAFNNTGDRLKITNISQWGPVFFNSQLGAFFGCSNLNVTAPDGPILAGNQTSFFTNCTSLTGSAAFNSWDVSAVNNFSLFFQACTNFNQNIGNWDLGAAVTTNRMFSGATSFNNVGSSSINNWNVSNVSNFGSGFAQGMFYQASAFNQPLGNWDVSGASTMYSMFHLASAFNQDISAWNVSGATNLGYMFHSASSFNQNIGGWNVGNVVGFFNMFQNAAAFNQNLGAWNVSKAASFTSFMAGKTAANFSAANLDAIYNGWSALTFVNTGLSITFGSAKYTAAGAAGRAILTGAPNNWTIADGGI